MKSMKSTTLIRIYLIGGKAEVLGSHRVVGRNKLKEIIGGRMDKWNIEDPFFLKPSIALPK